MDNRCNRKRRLLDEFVSSTHSPPMKRDASTSTTGNKPMTLDMYTQTEEFDDGSMKLRNLEAQCNAIFQLVSNHDAILREIRDNMLSNNSTINSERQINPIDNLKYTIIADGNDAISVEPIDAANIIEEKVVSPANVAYEAQNHETPKTHNYLPLSAIHTNQNSYPYNIAHCSSQVLKELNVDEHSRHNTPEDTQDDGYLPIELKMGYYGVTDDPSMIIIGPNGTKVGKPVLKSIKWDSASNATRKLLTTVFNRETLATHSLTGRPSPAFHGRNKPAKHQLNVPKVDDIIKIVSKCCHVPEKEVRNAITTKCADENKMFNQRLRRQRDKENMNTPKI